eukprot:scaffold2947_cov172-Pinguiococcus_pyrenoidosus.AAC.1
MSVSPTVFQREMWPYLASAAGRSLSHSCTAVRRSGRQGQSAQNLLNTWPPALPSVSPVKLDASRSAMPSRSQHS